MGAVGGVQVPVGLILLATAVPASGPWQRYSAADGRLIMIAGGSYAPGAIGGSWTAGNLTSSSDGGHTGHSQTGMYTTAPWQEGIQNATAGAHSHAVTPTYYPQRQRVILIKSTAGTQNLPGEAVVLADAPISGWGAAVYPNDYWPFGGVDWSNFSASISGAVGSAGSHNHPGVNSYNSNYPAGTGWGPAYASGAHTGHTASLTATCYLRYVFLRALVAAVAKKLVTGIIGLWDQSTVPAGWTELTGFRDYFLRLSTSGTGATGGNNTLAISGSLSSYGWTHQHANWSHVNTQTAPWNYAGSVTATHSHSVSGTVSYLPAYLALKAIKFTG